MPVYLCLHFPLITKALSFIEFPFSSRQWLFVNAGPRAAAGTGLGMGCRAVEAQRYVAESSGWDPLMYMEL